MIRYLKRIVVQNIVSPSGLAIISYWIFLFAWLFPSGLYTEYIHEPDLMFLDPLVLAFYTSCVAAFLLGVRASRFVVNGGRNSAITIAVRNPLLYLSIPLFLSLVRPLPSCCTPGAHFAFCFGPGTTSCSMAGSQSLSKWRSP